MSPKMRTSTGNISEFAAVLMIVVPLALTLLFVGYEFAYGYMIKSNLDNAAKNAARAMAIAYGQDSSIAANQSKQQAVYTPIRVANFVNSNQQFTDPDFKPAGANPKSVTVTVSYLPGQYGLPMYPYPDPLNMAPTLRISGTYTYRLEDE
jgi:Flp pilus assembly protein TadG